MFEELVEELVALTDDEIVARIEANELERRRLDAEMSAALAIAEHRGLDGRDGHRSMTAFCRARLNWSTSEAGRRLGLARAVDHVPGLGASWFAGRFGISQATQFSRAHGNRRVRDRLGSFAPLLLDDAEQLPYSDFAIAVDHFVKLADEDGAHDDRDESVDGRRARVVAVGGSLDLRASGGDGLSAAEMIAVFDRFVDAEFRSDVEARRLEHGDLADGFALRRTDRQRRFDALLQIFRTAAAATSAGSPSEPLVNIAIDAHTWGRLLVDAGLSTSTDLTGRSIDPFTGLPVDDTERLGDDLLEGRCCETSNGVQLHPHDVLRAALAGHVRRVVVDSRRVVIDMGRRQRLFTGNARQAARLLVRRCEHAGCELPADWCEIDHVEEWDRDLGRTDQWNAAVHCAAHNRDKHRRRWRTRRATNGVTYTERADGTLILPVGVRPPRFDDTDDTDGNDAGDRSDGDDPVDSPEHIARLTRLARSRVDALR